ncbi:MAG: FAD-dependent oxidoreductase [Burkholderiales bacterium]|nr:FAD-dependent oxidoreductase [Burkholderiales bacterium]
MSTLRETDLAIIGAGVAGLTAAAAAAQQGLKVLVIERMGAGGQVMTVERIDNMPGFAAGTSGFELGPELQERAEAAGVEFTMDTVQALEAGAGGRHVLRCEGESVSARAVLVAAGSARRKLGVPGEEQLEGRGVSHCASCDGPLFRGQSVVVAGGGDSAFGEAMVLAGHAAKVTLVFREPAPHAQEHLVRDVTGFPNVELIAGAEIVEITGDAKGVTGVMVLQGDAPPRQVPAEGVFVYAGLQADSQFLAGVLKLDAQGRIETNGDMGTSVPGVFAAGDIRSGAEYLLASAALEGAAAAQFIALSLRA